MCRLGDIILIRRYEHHGVPINNHSFVVIEDSGGQIEGVPFDFIGNVFSSFKSEDQKQKKLSFPGNIEVSHNDTQIANSNRKDGFIKAEQFYYFNKSKIDYQVIGTMTPEMFNKLIDFISELQIEIINITDNL